MYLHRDHKYLFDKGLPSFVLKPSEETQVKAKFGLIDNFLASDLAGGQFPIFRTHKPPQHLTWFSPLEMLGLMQITL